MPKDPSRIILLKKNLSEWEAWRHEIYMISVFGRKDLGTGILRNRTNGGEGSSGLKLTDKHKRILKIRWSGPNNPNWKGGKIKVKSRYRTGEEFKETRSQNAQNAAKARTKEGLARGGSAALKKLIEKNPNHQKEAGKKGGPLGGARSKELGVGICGISTEERRARGKEVAAQKWKCLVTGHISSAGSLTLWQRKRGIDTSLRERLP